MRRLVGAASLAAVLAVTACAADTPDATLDGVSTPEGVSVGVIAEGFDGPTQFVPLGDDLIVAELNGGERDGTGRVVRVATDDPTTREVLVDGLVAPTGLAVDGDLLWIMEQRRLTVGPVADPDDRTVVLDELPFNGRSEGSLTAVEPTGILYDTSGSRDPSRPAELEPGSGTLWRLSSPDADPTVVATGFKHAYAHVVDGAGRLWSTEMSDGRLDGQVPPDELVEVDDGDDFGYPTCVGDRVPVAELGATASTCASTPRSHALFEPGATPTSVAVAPWDPELLVVALWNRGEVVTIPATPTGAPHRAEALATGLDRPQHLVTVGDRLVLSEFGTGRILEISAG